MLACNPVNYILFLTADVTVTPNTNEVSNYKYVDKAELQAMFEDPSTCVHACSHAIFCRQLFTLWFKLIAHDLLFGSFGWWDALMEGKTAGRKKPGRRSRLH
jgi:isopentenyl-diphosphate delta-isomerase